LLQHIEQLSDFTFYGSIQLIQNRFRKYEAYVTANSTTASLFTEA
jgi:hypothetical protein